MIFLVGDLLTNSSMDAHKAIFHTAYEGLDLIPAFLTLAEIEEQMKADIRTPQQFQLKSHLSNVQDDYDHCILDCPPSISINVAELTYEHKPLSDYAPDIKPAGDYLELTDYIISRF